MDANQLLENLLESAKTIAEEGKTYASDGLEIAKEQLVDLKERVELQIPEAGPERDAMLKNLGVGAAAGGLLALLVGTQSGRKILSPAVKIGSLGALGALGYKVYTEWQKRNEQTESGSPIANLEGPAVNDRSVAILQAMIVAAQADGVIDDQEKKKIATQIDVAGFSEEVRGLLIPELEKPVDLQKLAEAADSSNAAVEMYLASLTVVDIQNADERSYLDRLSAALGIDPTLQRELELAVLSG
jgi:uncharacterized membrane protein YebE (DUF533 family)